jgi:hypothetical protein
MSSNGSEEEVELDALVTEKGRVERNEKGDKGGSRDRRIGRIDKCGACTDANQYF